MKHNRREFLGAAITAIAAAGVAGSPLAAISRAYDTRGDRIGMCDWNLGRSAELETVDRVADVGLNGVQVSIGTRPDHIPLREPAIRRAYLEAANRHGISFPSVAAGSILNQIPLKSEPQSAVYVIDAVEAASALSSGCILIAFFSDGDLRLRDASGNLRTVSTGPYHEYELDARGVKRVVEVLRQIVPRAEDRGIVLGLENTLTAEQNLDIIDQIDSPTVQVYYDVGNSTSYHYDVASEIRMLGRERICEIHIKETLGLRDPEWGLLGGPGEGGVDFDAVSAALRDIDYDGWFVLETSGRESRFAEDTRANIRFVRERLR